MSVRSEVERDMAVELGCTPALLDRLPDEFLGPHWELMKRAQFGETLIPRMYRDLIGLAAAAANRCEYGIVLHTALARLDGAGEAELAETLHYAGLVSGWGVMLAGLRVDHQQIQTEASRIAAHLSTERSI